MTDEAIQRLTTYLTLEHQQRKIWDETGQITAVEELGGSRCHYTYDQQGNLTQIEAANGRTTGYEYDEQCRLVRSLHADGTETTYNYQGEPNRLTQVSDRGILHQFIHDAAGRLIQVQHGNAGSSVYRYNAKGEAIEARTSMVSTQQTFNEQGQVTQICQTLDGVTLQLTLVYDNQGRLSCMTLPGQTTPLHYQWDEQGWPLGVTWGNQPLATFEYERTQKISRIRFANGVIETTQADPIDCRPVRRQVCQGDRILFQQIKYYTPAGQVSSDGLRHYTYDALGRLASAVDFATDEEWHYDYDEQDNCIRMEDSLSTRDFDYDADNRLVKIAENGSYSTITYDNWGRSRYITTPSHQRVYRYNDAHQLLQVLDGGVTVAQFTYDHKGRLVLSQTAAGTERYFYGADDALLAVTDRSGNALRLYLRSPLGLLAEIWTKTGEIFYRHHDDRGTCHLVSDRLGTVVAQFRYNPFGVPLATNQFQPIFTGHLWVSAIQLYYLGARWYDPHLGRFITPDSYTGTPDDERIVNPLTPASKQVFARAEILGIWLKHPRVRNRYAYCNNDPVNRVDPNGHWSFGGVLLSILGAIWTLPNTLLGLVLEITCLVGEVIRWLVWLITFGNVSWETPGFDAAASSRLNAFALVFEGGWLGSFSRLLGITFGNVFFVYKHWRTQPAITALPSTVYPPAYKGSVSIPSSQALYEHELRHTNQYGWFGPFFHLGLPIWGVYVWDVIINRGYDNSWLERDAEEYSGL